MKEILIVLYAAINIAIVVRYYKRPLGVFQAPFLFACVSLTIIFPQLTTIYFHPYYDDELIYKLGYVMITGNLFFVFGFEKGKKRELPASIRTIDFKKAKKLILVFAVLGSSTILMYNGMKQGDDFVIVNMFKSFAFLALALSLNAILDGARGFIIYVSLALSVLAVSNYAFIVKGSRIDSLSLGMNILLFIALAYPKRRKKIQVIVLVALLFGSVLSASISDIRKASRGEEGQLDDISFFEKFQESFTNSVSDVGMDLGNAALGIDFAYEHDSYDYGLQIWNGFVYNYVPRRLVGEQAKKDMYFPVEYKEYMNGLTHHVTTTTAYFDSFAAFSFLGFLFFFCVGYLYGMIWLYSAYSNFYKFFYFYSLSTIAVFLSLGFQVLFLYIEFILFIIYPILSFFVIKKQLKR